MVKLKAALFGITISGPSVAVNWNLPLTSLDSMLVLSSTYDSESGPFENLRIALTISYSVFGKFEVDIC